MLARIHGGGTGQRESVVSTKKPAVASLISYPGGNLKAESLFHLRKNSSVSKGNDSVEDWLHNLL